MIVSGPITVRKATIVSRLSSWKRPTTVKGTMIVSRTIIVSEATTMGEVTIVGRATIVKEAMTVGSHICRKREGTNKKGKQTIVESVTIGE